MKLARTGAATFFSLAVAVVLSSHSAAWAQPVSVTHRDGLLTIQCKDAPLSNIFGMIEKEAGVELVLEDEVKSKRLSANLTDVPVAMAVQRLLEGAGVNYIVMMDPSNWGRVGKIFVGAGGGGPARSAQAPRGPIAPEPPEEVYEDTADTVDPLDAGNIPADAMENPQIDQQNQEEFGTPDNPDPGAQNPPGSSPIPDFFGQQQAFPRSNFTPGPANANPFGTQQQQQPQQQNPQTAPPATFPFTDPFGRPIPVPPEMNQQQQQQQQQQRKRQQQQ
jgi:hypothetical protein